MIITGAVYISQLLTVTHTLQQLDISYNNVSDDGMIVISEALQHNKSLTTLGVAECGLSVKGTVVCKMYYQWRRKLFKTRVADHAVNLVCMHVRTTAWTTNSSLSL